MEIAFRMQTEAPEVFDIRKESKATLRSLWRRRLRARLPDGAPAGRSAASAWCRSTTESSRSGTSTKTSWATRYTRARSDPAIAALIQDLKERGLLEDTLVIIGTEFGRTPVLNLGGFQSIHNGRDHNLHGFSVLLAGGGVKPGIYGATDDFGFKATENPVHVHDLHATALHLLGLDHEQLTYRYSGRDFRLTDVEGQVVKDVIAG